MADIRWSALSVRHFRTAVTVFPVGIDARQAVGAVDGVAHRVDRIVVANDELEDFARR